MALRHYTEIETERLDRWRIEIDDTDFGGAATEIKSGSAEGFALSYPISKDKLPAVMPSEFRYAIAVQLPSQEAFIGDISTSIEGRFRLGVYRWDGADWAFWWAGVVVPDVSKIEDLAFDYAFEISAVDGLSHLSKIDYNDDGDAYTGQVRIIEVAANILKKLPHVSGFWTGSDDFIRTIVDYYEDSMSYDAATCPLYAAQVNQRAFFRVEEKGKKRWMSCAAVLENIAQMFNLQIFLHNGFWVFQQIDVRGEISFYARQYNYAIDAPTAAPDMYGKVNIDPQDDHPRLSGGIYSYIPALRRVKITYNAQNRRNYIAGAVWNNTTGSPVTGDTIGDNSGSTVIRVTGTFTASFKNDGETPGEYFYPLWRIQVKVGSYYLKRTITVSGNQISASPMTWSNLSSSYYQFTTGLMQVPQVGTSVYTSGPVDFTTPFLPESGDFQFHIDFDEVLLGDFTETWSFFNSYVEVISNGLALVTTNDVEYEMDNPAGGGVEIHEFDTVFADGTDSNSAGALLTGTSQFTTLWGLGGETADTPLVRLLMQQMLKSMEKPRRKMSHTIYGEYYPFYYILDDGGNEWVWLGGTYTATANMLQGEWARLEYGSATYDPTLTVYTDTYTPTDAPGVSNPGDMGAMGLQNLAPATLEPVSAAKTASVLEAGAITSVPVSFALSQRAFVEDQVLAIVNLATGMTDELTVTADTEDGDTSIAVSGTLSDIYGTGSYIVVRLDNYTKQAGIPPLAWYTYKGVIGAVTSNRVFVPTTEFLLPLNDDNSFVIVRRQMYQSPDDYTLNYVDNSVDFNAALGLNGQTAAIKVFV